MLALLGKNISNSGLPLPSAPDILEVIKIFKAAVTSLLGYPPGDMVILPSLDRQSLVRCRRVQVTYYFLSLITACYYNLIINKNNNDNISFHQLIYLDTYICIIK